MDFIQIGKIVKPQGIRGEVKVLPMTDHLERFLELKEVFLEQKGEKVQTKVMGARIGADAAYLFLERVYDRNAAEALRGCALFVDRAHAAELPEGRYFIVDLIGAEVFSKEGKRIGVLKEVLQPGANDVFVVTIYVQNKRITVNAEMLSEEEIREN